MCCQKLLPECDTDSCVDKTINLSITSRILKQWTDPCAVCSAHNDGFKSKDI